MIKLKDLVLKAWQYREVIKPYGEKLFSSRWLTVALILGLLVVGASWLDVRNNNSDDSEAHVHGGHAGHGHEEVEDIGKQFSSQEVEDAWAEYLRDFQLYCIVNSVDIEVEFNGQVIDEEEADLRLKESVEAYNLVERSEQDPKSLDIDDSEIRCNT